MKNFWKFLAIIALVAVIGFSMAACSGGGGGGGTGSGVNWVGKWVNVDDPTDYFILNADNSWTFDEEEQISGGYGSEWRYDAIGLGTGPAIVLVYASSLGGNAGYYLIIDTIIDSTTVKFKVSNGYSSSTPTYKKQ